MSKKKKDITDVKDLFKSLSAQLKSDDLTDAVEWILSNQMKTEDGLLISYDDRKFLLDLVRDESPKQVILASAQVGKTITMYLKALFMCFKGLNVIFSEPTADLRDLLTKSKLNRLIENNPIFRETVTGDMNVKNVRDRMLFLVYTFGNAQVGFSGDLCIYDEVSRSNSETIDSLKSRLLNSKFKYEWFISNPAAPHDLLHRTFLLSDQKCWAITCNHCKREQILNYDGIYGFKGNVCKDREQLVCQQCDEILDPQSIIDGRWLKRYKNRDISGYWIHQLMRPTKSLEEQKALVKEAIFEEKKNKSKFMNFFMGLPYGGSDVTVDASLIKSNLVQKEVPKNGMTLGVDIGSATGHHYVLGANGVVHKMGRAKDWGEIRELINIHAVQMTVVDNMPENGSAKELQRDYPNMVWRSNYVPNKSEQVIKYDEETGLVHVSRNLQFDQLITDLSKGVYKFNYRENDFMLDDFCKQFATLSKIAEFDRSGNPVFKWEAPEGAWDHFAHAFLYWTVSQHRYDLMIPKFGVLKSDDGESGREAVQARDMDFGDNEETSDWMDL